MLRDTHRILFLIGQLGGGGLERQLFYLLSAIDKLRYRPAVAVWDYNAGAVYASKIEELGIPIYPVERKGSLGTRLVRLRKLVRRIRPEVLHSYSFHTNFPSWFAMVGMPGVVIGSLRNDYWAERKGAGLVRGVASSMFPRSFIANSLCAQKAAQYHNSLTAPKEVFFIPNAIDFSQLQFVPLSKRRRFEIVGIGRLYPQKNWTDTLHALAQFHKRVRVPWRFRLCGSGPLEPELRQLSERLGITEQIEFLGFREDIREILASSHVLIGSSAFEGTPNAILEAMAIGRPIVHTSVGDVPRLVTHGKEGFLVSQGDNMAMAERLETFAKDPPLLELMGVMARKKIECEPSPADLVDQTLAVYREIGWKN